MEREINNVEILTRSHSGLRVEETGSRSFTRLSSLLFVVNELFHVQATLLIDTE